MPKNRHRHKTNQDSPASRQLKQQRHQVQMMANGLLWFDTIPHPERWSCERKALHVHTAFIVNWQADAVSATQNTSASCSKSFPTSSFSFGSQIPATGNLSTPLQNAQVRIALKKRGAFDASNGDITRRHARRSPSQNDAHTQTDTHNFSFHRNEMLLF